MVTPYFLSQKLMVESLFGNMVAIVFQITFRTKMHANDVFLFFKKLFLTSAYQNNLKTLKIY